MAYIGKTYCPLCNELVKKQSIEEITNEIISKGKEKDKIFFLSPLVQEKKELLKFIYFSKISRFLRVRV